MARFRRSAEILHEPRNWREFVYGFDSIKRQKDAAYKRLLVREYFALHGPPDGPPMPTDERDRGRAKHAAGRLGFITAQFTWSLENQHDLTVHSSFADFASGLLCQHDNNVEGCSLPYFPPEQFIELKGASHLESSRVGFVQLASAAAAKTTKGNPASCLTGSLSIGANGGIMRALTFKQRLEEAAKSAAVEAADPWRLTLERVHGKVDFFDRLERISSQTLLDMLEVLQRSRTAGTYRRFAKVMAELGWTAVRVRDLTRGGYLEQTRGYCRRPRDVQAGH